MSETQLQYIDVQDTSSLAYTLWRPEVCAISIFLYLSTIYTIRKVMANRGEFQLKNAMRQHADHSETAFGAISKRRKRHGTRSGDVQKQFVKGLNSLSALTTRLHL